MKLKRLLIPFFYLTPFYLVVQPVWRYLLFVAGFILGLVLMVLDEASLAKFYQEPERTNSEFDQESNQSPYLVSRSTLFLIALVPLALFVVTSTGSALGSGLVLGLLLSLIIEMAFFRQLPQLFNQRFLTQLKTEFNQQQINQLFWFMLVFFIFLNLLVIF